MECPKCGLAVLVENGKISPHLRPGDMHLCDGAADNPAPAKSDHKADDDHAEHVHVADAAPAKKAPAKKAPAKKTPPKEAP